MPNHPLAEVFGFPADNLSVEAERYRNNKLCPYNNKVPSCTKDKAKDPLGVCTVFDGDSVAITGPIRFRQDWFIVEDAARFFFPPHTSWTSLQETRLNDANGQSAGNIDFSWSPTTSAAASRILAPWRFKASTSSATCGDRSSATWPTVCAART